MGTLNTGNLAFLAVSFLLVLMALQRTVPKRRWLTLVVIVLPIAFFTLRWARFREQTIEWQYAAGAAVVFNFLFWLVYGRTHPPGHKGDIIVLGMEDED